MHINYSYPYPQFVTATILEWKHLLVKDKYKNVIVNSLKFLVDQERIKVYGFVIMPNHIHVIWHLQNDWKKEQVQRDFLKYTAHAIKFDLIENHPLVLEKFRVNAKDREYQIWERNPKITDLYSEEVLVQKLIYIHNNPLQAHWNLAQRQEDYKYSSGMFYCTGIDNFGFLSDYRG